MSLAYLLNLPQVTRNAYGSIALVLSAAFALLSNILARQLSQCYPPMQILFFKGLVASCVLIIVAAAFPAVIRGAKAWGLHIIRGFIGLLGNYLSVVGLKHLMIADATALSLTSAFWGLFGGVALLNEKASPIRWLATLGGFLGALLIVKPGSINFNEYALYPLGAAFCFAVSVLIVRKTGRTDGPIPSMLGLYGIMMVCSIPWVMCEWTPVTAGDYLSLCSVGLVSIMSMYFITVAYILAEASYLAPYKFIRYPFSILIGLFYFGDVLHIGSLSGGVVIVVALWIVTASERWIKKHPRNPLKP